MPISVNRPGVFLFAGVDAKGKMVLPRRQGTGSKIGKGAGRAVGFVEIDNHFSGRVWRRDVKIPAGAISLTPGSLIGNHLAAFLNRGYN